MQNLSRSWVLTACGAFALAVPAVAQSAAASAEGPLTLECTTSRVGQFERVEMNLQFPRTYSNSFDPDEVEVSVRFNIENAKEWVVPAFYCQQYDRRLVGNTGQQRDWLYPHGLPVWKVRFAPMQPGSYQAVAILKDHTGARTSAPTRFECVASQNKGFVRASTQDPRFLEFANGQPFFPVGQNLAFIGSQQYVNLSKAGMIFARLSENGANYARVWTSCDDWAMAIEARKSAWGRSWNWHPPFSAAPAAPDSPRQCLMLKSSGATLRVDPSHPVALLPGTRYVLTGMVRTSGAAEIDLDLPHGAKVRLVSQTSNAWTAFRSEFDSSPDDYWLSPLSFTLRGAAPAWIDHLSLKEAAGGPELLWEAEINHPRRGFYNPLDCFMLDELVLAAEQNGIYLQLCLLTRDLYMSALGEPASANYKQAIADARKLLRYAVARWGCSTSVAAWEYWNEMNPNLPADAFYSALGEYLEQVDPYSHLRTTSTWGPSPKDCAHPKLDLADVHFYLRPADRTRLRDEVDAVLERTRWLRQQAPHKPAHLGEFGLANDQWQITDAMKESSNLADFHNALWASALSGSSGTALFWWWERLDQRNAYPIYRPLSAFIRDVPWNSGKMELASLNTPDARLTVEGLRTGRRAWFWIFHHDAAWSKVALEHLTPGEIHDAVVELDKMAPGNYGIEWYDTQTGQVRERQTCSANAGKLRLSIPRFSSDIACKVSE